MNLPKIRAVRVDHYSNGKLLPIGVTYEDNTTDYIGTIHKHTTVTEKHGSISHYFKCETSNTKMMLDLSYKYGKWYLLSRSERILAGQMSADIPTKTE